MRLVIIRRVITVRLALLFLLDYWKIYMVSKRLHGIEREEAINRICKKSGRRMKKTAFLLKGMIVKIGQFLSMRHDIFPKAFTNELIDLQDSLPAVPFHKIYRSIEKELGQPLDEVFHTFEKDAIAAASLAQVHRAVLKDGNKVAVKIFRPKIEQIAQADMRTLRLIALVVQRIPALSKKMDFVELHREFSKTIYRELDGIQEMSHIERFKHMFGSHHSIKVPYVFEQYTSKRLLIMEFIEAINISDRTKLQENNIDSLRNAELILECYLRQILVHGFIHLDPHPGNILIKHNGDVCFLDFGMVAQLSKQEVQTFRYLIQSIMLGDVDGIVSSLDKLGYIPDQRQRDKVTLIILNVFESLNESNHKEPSFQRVIGILRSFIKDNPIQLQAKYMFLMRCIGILMTTLTTLAPNISLMETIMKIGPEIFNTPIAVDEERE
jgi:predicted unusual protein kinase regulating ubiquinone biosynthesis (AarF/ABC1/UbiB family)